MTDEALADPRLRQSLKRRHMTMIALGGVIGAGLFVGSGVVIQSAGPAAVLSFALTGALVVLVMRMLGEMAASYPAVGGFYEYNRLALGELAGPPRRIDVLLLTNRPAPMIPPMEIIVRCLPSSERLSRFWLAPVAS